MSPKSHILLLGMVLMTSLCLTAPEGVAQNLLKSDEVASKTGSFPTTWWQPLTPPEHCSVHLGMAVVFTKTAEVEFAFHIARHYEDWESIEDTPDRIASKIKHDSDEAILEHLFSDELKLMLYSYLAHSQWISQKAENRNLTIHEYTTELLQAPCIRLAVAQRKSDYNVLQPIIRWHSMQLETLMLISSQDVLWHNVFNPEYYTLIMPNQLPTIDLRLLYYVSGMYQRGVEKHFANCRRNLSDEFSGFAISCPKDDLMTASDGSQLCWQPADFDCDGEQDKQFQHGLYNAKANLADDKDWSWEKKGHHNMVNIVHSPESNPKTTVLRKPLPMPEATWRASQRILNNVDYSNTP